MGLQTIRPGMIFREGGLISSPVLEVQMVLSVSTRAQVKWGSITYPILKLEPADSHNVVSQVRMELSEKLVFVRVEAIEGPAGGYNIPAGAVGSVVASEKVEPLAST